MMAEDASSLADLGEIYRRVADASRGSGNLSAVWRMLPESANVEDRRQFSLGGSLKDLAQSIAMRLTDSPVPWHEPTGRVFPSGPYTGDINDTTKRIQMQSLLDQMADQHAAKVKLDAWNATGNPSVAGDFTVLGQRR